MRNSIDDRILYTLVRSRDRVVFVTGKLCTADHVAPLGADFVTGFDVDHGLRHRGTETGVASDVAIVDILNGVVRVGRPNAN